MGNNIFNRRITTPSFFTEMDGEYEKNIDTFYSIN